MNNAYIVTELFWDGNAALALFHLGELKDLISVDFDSNRSLLYEINCISMIINH